MGRYGDLDYPVLAKRGFLLGLTLLVIGGVGELVGHTGLATLPAWEEAILFDLEVIGLLVGFFSPLVFGILLPLTE